MGDLERKAEREKDTGKREKKEEGGEKGEKGVSGEKIRGRRRG